MAGEDKPEINPDREKAELVFEAVPKLLETQGSTSGEIQKVPVGPKGFVEAQKMGEIISGQPDLNICDAKIGDVVWWRDVEGHNGYFLVTAPYNLETRPQTYGRGAIRAEIDERKIDSDEAFIRGAGFGGMTKLFHISKNIPVEFVVPGKDAEGIPKPRTYRSKPIAEMGIIRSELTNPT